MKKSVIVVITTVLLLLILPIIFFIGGFLLPPCYTDTFLGELQEKVERLETTQGKRIIFLGGSSVAFGVDSALIKEAFPEYEVVNFGMYANLGTTVMFDLSAEEIGPGDVVIISPEQSPQTLSGYFNGASMWQGVDGAFSMLGKLSGEQLSQMAGNFPAFAADKWRYFLSGDQPDPQGVYAKSAFNQYGDIESPLCGNNIMLGEYDTNMPIVFEETMISQEFLQQINAYIDKVTQAGAVVWYRFCPMNALAVEEEGLIDYYAYLSSQLHCHIMGDPEKSIMEPGWFYDSNFHLNQSGKIVNTIQIIKDLKAMWGDATPTLVEQPAMPEPATPQIFYGDDQDRDCFLYEVVDSYVVISGLSREGEDRSHLTIPTTYEGLPVLGFKKETFQENTVMEEVTIQENITKLEDGSFFGCDNLQRIFINNTAPHSITPGQNLLEGCHAQIYVPKDSYSNYCVNYFWSVYASQLRTAQ